MCRRSTAGQYAVEGDVRVGGVALTVHNDYAMLGAPVRMENFFKPPRTNDSFRPLGDAPLIPPDEYEDLSKRRWAFINVWRNLADYPIVDTPLAMVDAKTFDKNDLLTLDFRYVDATIETYIAAHNPKHRWIYFPNMTKHEAILLKTYDSQGALFQDEHNYPPYHKDEPPVPASFAIHSAFRNPLAPPDYPPRYSIEVRTVVFY